MHEHAGGAVATCLHTGSYDDLSAAWDAFGEWIEAQGKAPGAPPWESYVMDPGDEPDTAKWQTRLFWPIRQGAR